MKPPFISLGLISATALAYEILLMRLFSIIQWHHFAYMIISLALLGYGISGTLISIFQKPLVRSFSLTYPLLLLLFSLASFICFFLAQSIAFNPEAILWDSQQTVYLLSIFIILSIPFLLTASAICLVFIQYPQHISRIYSIDLLGAGVGSISIIGLLFLTLPLQTLFIISLSGLLAALIAAKETRLYYEIQNKSIKIVSMTAVSIIALSLFFIPFSSLTISPYKGLSKTLNIKGAQLIEQQSSPLGLLSIVESPVVPFRHVPGLSLYNTQEPLEQLALFTDASNLTAITQYPDKPNQLAYLDQLTSALAYHLKPIGNLLIVGAGGGSDILQAMYHQTGKIDAVELNQKIIDLLTGPFAQYSGQIYLKENVQIYAQDIRGFLSNRQNHSKQNYDLIQISLMDSFNASASGLYALNESYLYTIEALEEYIKHLKPDAYLSISRWIKTPPRDTLKLFATAIDALKKNNIHSVENHLVLIRSWQTSTLLIKPTPFNRHEIKQLKQFSQNRGFDVVWYPGIQANETNQFNQFRESWFYQSITRIFDEQSKDTFFDNYKYSLYPATDDKPFFHHFFKWSSLQELLSLKNQGGLMLVEMGYIVLISTLFLAIISSIILIILPLFVFHFKSKKVESFDLSINAHIQLFSYFFAIGLAFLFIEIAMMQKMTLLLHHPIYAIPVVLMAFLVFAGIGSAWTGALLSQFNSKQILFYAIVSLVIVTTIYSVFLNSLFAWLSSYSIVIKFLISVILIAPLALCMGMPMPLALKEMSDKRKGYIPWAWGINGCASVISAVLASLLAIHYGFNQVIMLGMGLYIICLLIFTLPEKVFYQ